jgi:hypothetical protein
MAPREQKRAISKTLVNQWRNDPLCCHRLAHHLAFTKCDTLLKIASLFSSAVVIVHHELLLANVVEWG